MTKRIFFLLTLCAFCSTMTVAQTKKLNTDLTTIMTWFTGEFDNFAQAYQEKEDSVAVDLRHEHIHSIFTPVKMPAIGTHVLFVKQYSDGDESKVYRQRIYQFTVNKTEKALQLDILSFLDATEEKKYAMAYKDPKMLLDMKPEQLKPAPGCEVYWKRNGDHFIGYMKDRACNFVSKRSGKRIYVTDSLMLSQKELWIRDEAEDEDGKYVFGHKEHIAHKLKRCQYFKGWAAVQKPAPEKGYYGMFNLKTHDQGGRIRLVRDNGEVTPYSVELAQLTYGSKTPVFKIAIYEEGKDKAIAYAWANPEAKNIGINLRSVQAGFTIEK